MRPAQTWLYAHWILNKLGLGCRWYFSDMMGTRAMSKLMVLLLASALTGCAELSFKKEMETLQQRRQTAINEIQRQQQLQKAMIANSHSAWISSLTPQQLAVYRSAESDRQASQMRQNMKLFEGMGGLFQKLFSD